MAEWKSTSGQKDFGEIPRVVVHCCCDTGENPLWHPDWKLLLWVDIPKGELYGYSPISGNVELLYRGEISGGFTIQDSGELLLFQKGGAIRSWSPSRISTIVDSIPGEEDTRFNDVFADPWGRVFAGTMSSRLSPGRLYRIETNGGIKILAEGIGISNGIGMSPDKQWFYHTDSLVGRIYRYTYDALSGDISNKTVFKSFPVEQGVPDGMKIDLNGNLWIAMWGGNCIRVVDPGGNHVRVIDFPVPRISNLAADYSGNIFVTTATEGMDNSHCLPNEGALFVFKSGEAFLANNRSSVHLKN